MATKIARDEARRALETRRSVMALVTVCRRAQKAIEREEKENRRENKRSAMWFAKKGK
jgi:hypothetical protein